MKRTPSKKGTDRRKRPRGKSSTSRTSPSARSKTPSKTKGSSHPTDNRSANESDETEEFCLNCAKELEGRERALFVEEEVGRIFCSENCIASYFTPEIERLEKEYHRRLSSSDLSGEERESLAHLRWITLQEPDEVWREKTLTGDYRYTLISEFSPGEKRIWCVCICLFLRGEPSFLYLAFPTRNAAMVSSYRRGERVEWVRATEDLESETAQKGKVMDGLASDWTEDETLRAQLIQERRSDDISPEDFGLYQSCLEETLESPDEVWSVQLAGPEALKLYHFLRQYPNENPNIWYIIVAKETDDEEQIEILDAFPTRDSTLVDRYRRGQQEVGTQDTRSQGKIVH